ncbi:MAG: EamA family transporter [Anaerolineae bacterium]|nr:EamA family transporter [Anaerolineae bacterium]
MDRLLGVALIILSAAAFGTLPILGRYAYADGMDALTILFIRFSLAAALMVFWLIIRHERLPRGAALWKLAGMGGLGYVGQAFAFFTALRYASAGLVSLLLYLYPVFVTLLAVLLLHEPFTRIKAGALLIALIGTTLTVGPLQGQALGIALAIAAAVIYSAYIIIGANVLRETSSLQSSTVIFAAAGTSAGALMLINGPQFPTTTRGWITILAMVLVATLIAIVTFLAGLKRIGPTNAAMLSTLEPGITVLLASWLLHETLRPISLLGGGLILAAVLLLTIGELRHKQLTDANPKPESNPGAYRNVSSLLAADSDHNQERR